MSFSRTAAIMALSVTAVFVSFSASMAGPYAGYVTAYSRFGNGVVRAPVRAAQFGYQVKIPGGPWLYCERNSLIFDRNRPCSETLRRQTLDFWETQTDDLGGRR